MIALIYWSVYSVDAMKGIMNEVNSNNRHIPMLRQEISDGTDDKEYPILRNFSYMPYTQRSDTNVAVIGLIAKNRWRTVRPYFHSLRGVGYKGAIIMFVHEGSYEKYQNNLTDYDIQPIIFSEEYPYYPANHPIYPIPDEIRNTIPHLTNIPFFFHIIRHILFDLWLKVYKNKFTHIFFSDVRDIAFQHNPFSWNYNDKGIYFTEETQHCNYIESRSCSLANYNWIMIFNPPQSYLETHTFVNSGQIFGSSTELLLFYNDYIDFMSTRAYNETCDQGVLNYWLIENKEKKHKYPLFIFKAEAGYARILGIDLQYSDNKYGPSDKDLLFRNEDGTIPLAIHQYEYGFKFGSDERKEQFRLFLFDIMNNSRRVIMNTQTDYYVVRKLLINS